MVQNFCIIYNLQDITDKKVLARLAQVENYDRYSIEKRTILHSIYEVMRLPKFQLLITFGALYLVFGDAQKALMFFGFVFMMIGFTNYQEQKIVG